MMNEKVIVDLRYLHEVVKNLLSDEEVLQGFMEYYFAQSRTLHDLRSDLIYRLDKVSFCYTSEQYIAAYDNVKRVLTEYLKKEFNMFESFINLD